MFNTFVIKTYLTSCAGFSVNEAVDFITEVMVEEKPFYYNRAALAKSVVKQNLYEFCIGKQIPSRMTLLMLGGFPSFDNIAPKEQEAIEDFNKSWDSFFAE